MSQLESPKFSYIRAFHEVEPSPSLEALSAYASELLVAESFADPLHPELRPSLPNVYPTTSLRVTVFEGFAPAGDAVTNELLRKLQYRLESPTFEEIRTIGTNYRGRVSVPRTVQNPLMTTVRDIRKTYLGDPSLDRINGLEAEPLTVSSSSIVISTKEQFRGQGTQLALLLDKSEVTSYLEGESGAYIDQANRIVFAKRLSWLKDERQAREVPILSAPFRSENQAKEFAEQLGAGLPAVGVIVGEEVDWANTIRKSAH